MKKKNNSILNLNPQRLIIVSCKSVRTSSCQLYTISLIGYYYQVNPLTQIKKQNKT